MSGSGSMLAIAGILVWFGWKMLSENWLSVSKREGMYDKASSDIALLSAIPMMFFGGALLLLGLSGLVFWLLHFFR